MSFRVHFPDLPSYIQVEIVMGELPVRTYLSGRTYIDDSEGRNASCIVRSDIHKGSPYTLPNTWSEGFIAQYPSRFRGDIHHKIITMFGLTLDPPSYS